jgi:hypothetical protein
MITQQTAGHTGRLKIARAVAGAACMLTLLVAGIAVRAAQSGSRFVLINRVRLDDSQVYALEQFYHTHIIDGRYWYDRKCGAWGIEGGPTLGAIHAGLDVGGTLAEDASRGNTGVFVNGRELHYLEVMALRQLGPVYPGRYWLDASGNVGLVGHPAFCNIVALARSSGRFTKRRSSILSGMYDSGIGRVLGNGGQYISDNSSMTH